MQQVSELSRSCARRLIADHERMREVITQFAEAIDVHRVSPGSSSPADLHLYAIVSRLRLDGIINPRKRNTPNRPLSTNSSQG